jgi:hypothetical protein
MTCGAITVARGIDGIAELFCEIAGASDEQTRDCLATEVAVAAGTVAPRGRRDVHLWMAWLWRALAGSAAAVARADERAAWRRACRPRRQIRCRFYRAKRSCLVGGRVWWLEVGEVVVEEGGGVGFVSG